MAQCYLLCDRKAEITKGIPSGGNTERGTGNLRSVPSGKRLLLAGTRAELQQCLRLAPLEQPCQSSHSQQCLPSETCCYYRQSYYAFIHKNLVWVEAGGLYCSVWYSFAGEVHGVTCTPQEAYRCS